MAPPMLFALDSPFNNLPANLDERQAAWLHGIRFACWGAQISYDRLWTAADAFREPGRGPEPGELPRVQPLDATTVLAPLVDAWTFVDAAVRIEKFLGVPAFPRVVSSLTPKGGAPGSAYDLVRQMYRDASASALKIRNHVQHTPTRLDALVSAEQPLWGLLRLAFHVDREDTTRVVTFFAGTFVEADITVHMPLTEGKAWFSVLGEDIDLGALYVAIGEVADHLNATIITSLESYKAAEGIAVDVGPPLFADGALIRDFTRVPARPDDSGAAR
jgi:hypothetical protein